MTTLPSGLRNVKSDSDESAARTLPVDRLRFTGDTPRPFTSGRSARLGVCYTTVETAAARYPNRLEGYMPVLVVRGGRIVEFPCFTHADQAKEAMDACCYSADVLMMNVVEVYQRNSPCENVLITLPEAAQAVEKSAAALTRLSHLPKPCHSAKGKPNLWSWGRMKEFLETEFCCGL